MSQLKFSLKIWNNILIGGRTQGPMGPSPGYALAQDLKKLPDRKSQDSYADFAQSCRNYAGNWKNPDYYRLSSQVLLHPKLRS